MKRDWLNWKWITALVLLVLSAYWLYFTQPVQAKETLNGKPVTQIVLTRTVSTPGVNGGSVFTSVCTDNPTEIQKLIDFLNAYPCGRMIRNPLGVSPFSYQKTTTYSVALDYNNGKGVFKRLSYEVYPEGRVNVTGWKRDWNQSSVLCRVGRIGSQKTIQFYNRLSSMFEEKLKDTVWQKAE